MNLKGAIDLSCRALPMIARHRTTMSAASAWRRKNITKATGGTDRAEPRRGLQAASHNDRIQGYLERARGRFWSWCGCLADLFRASVPACAQEEKGHRGTYEFCRDGA